MGAPIGTVYEARLAHRGLARAAVSVEQLEREGYVTTGGDPRYEGSFWMLREVHDEKEQHRG